MNSALWPDSVAGNSRPHKAFALVVALLLAACRTGAPAANETPLAPGTPLAQVHAIRSLLRVRTTSAGRSESFRAQLLVAPAAESMELTIYTPLGTRAAVLFAERDRVEFVDDVNRTAWKGSAGELSQSIGFFGTARPVDWALAIAGYPRELGDVAVEYRDAGGSLVPAANVTAPAQRVVLTRGGAQPLQADISLLETYATDATPRAPSVPRDYRCCVLPGT